MIWGFKRLIYWGIVELFWWQWLCCGRECSCTTSDNIWFSNSSQLRFLEWDLNGTKFISTTLVGMFTKKWVSSQQGHYRTACCFYFAWVFNISVTNTFIAFLFTFVRLWHGMGCWRWWTSFSCASWMQLGWTTQAIFGGFITTMLNQSQVEWWDCSSHFWYSLR